jgi:hypothetical protein
MNKLWAVVVSVVAASAVTVLANCGTCSGDKAAGTDAAAVKVCCKDTGMFVCATDKTVSMKAGKCSKCGTDMAKMNVLAVKDGMASLCACEPGCKCTVKADDATKCSCGKDVVTLDVKAACKACKPAGAKAEPKAE